MVTLQDMMEMVFTPKELMDIEAGAQEFDRQVAEEIRQRNAVPEMPNHSREFYQAMEKEDLDTLPFLNRDIALMVKIRESFTDEGTIKALAEHFIRVNQYEIEEITERIDYDRRQARAA